VARARHGRAQSSPSKGEEPLTLSLKGRGKKGEGIAKLIGGKLKC